ncbi:MAG: glycolate oxidase subunit GlcF [Chromatiales bacterium]|jgi:glycolate oxidase iron-sulfur subunit|nr:glycolate oxidase subunit GlcF [Chromatiales bacterium]
MQTRLTEQTLASPSGAQAESILRRCVHCGFCNATCPTYQLSGNELDGPRGRIYLIKQMLEGASTTELTRQHLDRCLTCRSCETTCPSGVQYSHLLEIGREHIDRVTTRARGERVLRRLLRYVLPETKRVRWALRVAPYVRGLMPKALAAALPEAPSRASNTQWPAARHTRRMLALTGCVQPATQPQIDAAAARLLDRRGISLLRVHGGGCCGALSHHLNAAGEARAQMVRNIDAWWPDVEQGVEAIVSTSSACSVMLKDYGRLLGYDVEYGEKAKRISALVADASAVLSSLPRFEATQVAPAKRRISFHAPCSLQHGLRGHKEVERLLHEHNYELTAVRDPHLCCGAAGTYSIQQPELSRQLRANKLAALQAGAPTVIATANIGCLLHMQQTASVPVKHWLELLDEAER